MFNLYNLKTMRGIAVKYFFKKLDIEAFDDYSGGKYFKNRFDGDSFLSGFYSFYLLVKSP